MQICWTNRSAKIQIVSISFNNKFSFTEEVYLNPRTTPTMKATSSKEYTHIYSITFRSTTQ